MSLGECMSRVFIVNLLQLSCVLFIVYCLFRFLFHTYDHAFIIYSCVYVRVRVRVRVFVCHYV